jgi:hypothetical protein
MKDLAIVYFGADRPGANISEALLNSCWNQDMLTGFPAAYFAIKAFSETDMSEDLKTIDVPTLILHGDVDQIVPIGNAYRSSKLIPNATPQGVSRGTSRHDLDVEESSERRPIGLYQEVIANISARSRWSGLSGPSSMKSNSMSFGHPREVSPAGPAPLRPT